MPNNELKKVLYSTAKKFVRLSTAPQNSIVTDWEMKGKYGWFAADSKYKLTEYCSGYYFESQEELENFRAKIREIEAYDIH